LLLLLLNLILNYQKEISEKKYCHSFVLRLIESIMIFTQLSVEPDITILPNSRRFYVWLTVNCIRFFDFQLLLWVALKKNREILTFYYYDLEN